MKKTDNKRRLGTIYEEKSAAFLIDRGFEILKMNYRCKIGEIDIIAKKDECIHFVEVKYRNTQKCGVPLEAVNYKKQKIISKVSMYYIMENKILDNTAVCYDIISVLGNEISFYENAFDFRY